MRAIDYAKRLRWLEAWRARCDAFFRDEADAMITPTVPITAPIADDDAKSHRGFQPAQPVLLDLARGPLPGADGPVRVF